MAVIKYDVSGSDPDKALQNFEPPKPGVYRAKISEINTGFSKSDDGKPDKGRPRLEVILKIEEKGSPYQGSQVWDYVSFSEEAKWKLDQFLMAVGIATKTDKRKGQFNTDKIVGTVVKVRVVAEKGTTFGQDDYRAKVGALMPATAGDADPEKTEDDDPFSEDGDEDPFGGDGDEDPAEDGDGEDGDDGDEDPEDDGYDSMETVDLRKELKSRDLDTKGAKPALIKRLRENDNEEEPF